jgi:hypothetical protein
MAPKKDFRCESYALLKKDVNNNQKSMWQVEVGPCGDVFPNCAYKLSFK